MSDFDIVFMCFFVPISYAIVYMAGKGDLLFVACKMLQEQLEKYNERTTEEQKKVDGWILVEDRLPDNETEVEISCIRRYIGAGDVKKESYFTARAFYSDGTLTTEDSSFAWDEIDNWEYNEEKDAYVIPEGWWEYVTFSEQSGVVDAEVIAWKPLPAPYDIRKKEE